MGRDMAKKNAADYKWEKENCMRVNLKIRYDSGIPDAIQKVREDGKSANSYILEVLAEKLRGDGYLKDREEKND